MKTTLIEALQSELRTAERRIERLETRITKLELDTTSEERWWERPVHDAAFIERESPGYAPALFDFGITISEVPSGTSLSTETTDISEPTETPSNR